MPLKSLKVLLIGDFNFDYNAHHATNLSIEHSSKYLRINVDYYWVRIYEAAQLKPADLKKYDGIWLVPGPFENVFFLRSVEMLIFDSQLPFLVTGTGFKTFIEVIIDRYQMNQNGNKCISSNLFEDSNSFESVMVNPSSAILKEMYADQNREELTNARYSIYPNILTKLQETVIDVEATNEFGEPEIISLKSNPFCVASMSLPQICSTNDQPHPLVTGFLNYLKNKAG